MAEKLVGKDFTPVDVVAKVTGRAKYAEDFRADNMVFCKMLTSSIPHAKIRSIDTSAALKMQGVLGILTADDVVGWEKIIRKASSQGAASFSQAHREPFGQSGRVSEAEYNAMSAGERYAYSKSFDQRQFSNGR